MVLIGSSVVLADENTSDKPQWTDFCPPGMENPSYQETKWYNSHYRKWKNKDTNYWLKRKQEFEKDLERCESLPDLQRDACYIQLKGRQKYFNSEYEDVKNEIIQKGSQYEFHQINMQNFDLYNQ